MADNSNEQNSNEQKNDPENDQENEPQNSTNTIEIEEKSEENRNESPSNLAQLNAIQALVKPQEEMFSSDESEDEGWFNPDHVCFSQKIYLQFFCFIYTF